MQLKRLMERLRACIHEQRADQASAELVHALLRIPPERLRVSERSMPSLIESDHTGSLIELAPPRLLSLQYFPFPLRAFAFRDVQLKR